MNLLTSFTVMLVGCLVLGGCWAAELAHLNWAMCHDLTVPGHVIAGVAVIAFGLCNWIRNVLSYE